MGRRGGRTVAARRVAALPAGPSNVRRPAFPRGPTGLQSRLAVPSLAAILPQVAEIVHAHGLRFFWIPYWLAPGAGDWARLGFDAAYQQPNHFFHPEIKDQRLDEACAFARRNQMGMEFECDDRVYKTPEVFRPRLYSYLRAFEAGGVREQAAMAYYEGGGVLLDLFNSSDARSRADYQAIADWVVARQSRLADIR